jgi:PIN domain
MHTDRTNYIFIDYENVREIDLGLVEGKPVKVILATGKQQTTLPKGLVKDLLRLRDQVSLVENEYVGKNALDFVLVYEIAKQAIADPKGFFHVVSKDKGFDALVKHLHAQKIMAARIERFSDIPVLIDANKLSVQELADRYLSRLQRNQGSLATRKKTLLTQINGHFNKQLHETKLESVVSELIKRKLLTVSPTDAVSYPAKN